MRNLFLKKILLYNQHSDLGKSVNLKITLIEKEKNLSMQAVEEVYVEQIQEIQQSSKKQQGKRSKSENDFMKMLQSNRIIGK